MLIYQRVNQLFGVQEILCVWYTLRCFSQYFVETHRPNRYTDCRATVVSASVAGSVVPRDVQGNEITGGERNGAANSGEWNRYQLVNGMVFSVSGSWN